MRLAFLAMAACVVGCSSASSPSDTSTAGGAAPSTPVSSSTPPAAPASAPSGTTQAATADSTAPKDVPVSDLMNLDGKIDSGLPKTAGYGAKLPKDGDTIAILTTSEGKIYLRFFPQKAPNHVKNFVTLANKGFYDGTKFHRVIPGFMIQGGDPNTKTEDTSSWGMGGPGYTVKQEFNDVPHYPGILSMARTGDPDGAGSQFFIVHQREGAKSLDGQYTVFGEVISGLDVVNKIATTPTGDQDRPVKAMVLKKVEITKWPVKFTDN